MPRLITGSSPSSDGFHMPAEFERHDGCILVWPERGDTWRLGARPAQAAFAAVAAAICESEPVLVFASARQWEHARALLPAKVQVLETTTDDAWARDIAPTFVVDSARVERRGVDWIFNAWGGLDGGLFFPWANDDLFAAKVCEVDGADRYRAPLVLEGGSIHVDGEGTCITTEECLLHENRNPGLGRAEIERLLASYLGVERTVWLPRGVPNDETDGHVDNLACFVGPARVMLGWSEVPGDPMREVAAQARRVLERATDARGRALEVIPVPMPSVDPISAEEAAGLDRSLHAKSRRAGDELAASYVNFYLGNEVVVCPSLDPRHDDRVADLLASLFPGRSVRSVPAREILLGGGGIHCITQQIPALSRR